MTALNTRCPGVGLRAEASGRGPLGQMVRNESLVALSAVTLSDSADAVAGILPVHAVPACWASIFIVSAAPSGEDFGPTLLGAGRVSAMRQVSIGTRTGRSPLVTSADAKRWVVAPMRVPATRIVDAMTVFRRRIWQWSSRFQTQCRGFRPAGIVTTGRYGRSDDEPGRPNQGTV